MTKRLPAFAAIAIAAVLAGCNPQPRHGLRPAASPTPSGVPPLVITGRGRAGRPVRIAEQQGNRKVFSLAAHSYVSRSARNTAQASFSQARVTFYGKDGSRMEAQAPVARVDDARKLVLLEEGVHAHTNTGLTLTCDTLTYDRRTGLIHGTGNVRITGMQGGQQELLTGSTFTSNVKLTQMEIR